MGRFGLLVVACVVAVLIVLGPVLHAADTKTPRPVHILPNLTLDDPDNAVGHVEIYRVIEKDNDTADVTKNKDPGTNFYLKPRGDMGRDYLNLLGEQGKNYDIDFATPVISCQVPTRGDSCDVHEANSSCFNRAVCTAGKTERRDHRGKMLGCMAVLLPSERLKNMTDEEIHSIPPDYTFAIENFDTPNSLLYRAKSDCYLHFSATSYEQCLKDDDGKIDRCMISIDKLLDARTNDIIPNFVFCCCNTHNCNEAVTIRGGLGPNNKVAVTMRKAWWDFTDAVKKIPKWLIIAVVVVFGLAVAVIVLVCFAGFIRRRWMEFSIVWKKDMMKKARDIEMQPIKRVEMRQLREVLMPREEEDDDNPDGMTVVVGNPFKVRRPFQDVYDREWTEAKLRKIQRMQALQPDPELPMPQDECRRFMESFKVIEKIADGKYGPIMLCTANISKDVSNTLAVKMFDRNSKHAKERMEAEWRLYNYRPLWGIYVTTCHGIIRDHDIEGFQQYGMIALDYYPEGDLGAYLKTNTFTPNAAMRLLQSLADSLAYLHDEQGRSGQKERFNKECIIHRNLCSHHVLLRTDGLVRLCDFSTGMVCVEGYDVIHYNKQWTNSRYMAPEMLEELALVDRDEYRKAESYAFALIVWEVLQRVKFHDLDEPPPAKLPYEDEVPGVEGTRALKIGLLKYVKGDYGRPEFRPEIDSNELTKWMKEQCRDLWCDDPAFRVNIATTFLRIKKLLSGQGIHIPLTPFAYSTPPDSECEEDGELDDEREECEIGEILLPRKQPRPKIISTACGWDANISDFSAPLVPAEACVEGEQRRAETPDSDA